MKKFLGIPRWPTDKKIAIDAVRSETLENSPKARQIIAFASLAPGLHRETFADQPRFAVRRRGGTITPQRLGEMWGTTICQPDHHHQARPIPLIRIRDHWYRIPMAAVHLMRLRSTYRTFNGELLTEVHRRRRRETA